MSMRGITILCLFLLVTQVAIGQKKPLALADFDSWKSISSITMSKDGTFVLWQIEPQEGDGTLFFRNTTNGKTLQFARATGARLTPDNQFLVFTVKPAYEVVRAAKRKKTKKEDLPKDHLVIYTIATALSDTVKNIEKYTMPAEEGNWLAVTVKVEEPKKEKLEPAKPAQKNLPPPAKTKTTTTPEPAKTEKPKKPKMIEVTRLIQLGSGVKLEVQKVDKTFFPNYARSFYYLREKGDSTNPKGFYRVPLQTLAPVLVDSTFKGLTNVQFNARGTLVTYMTTPDSAKADLRIFSLKLYDGQAANVILDKNTKGMPKGWMPSPDFKTVIDENKRYMLVGTKPIPAQYAKDTLALEEEKVKLDIWHWQDADLQSYQLKNKKQFEEKSYLGRIDMNTFAFLQLADEEVQTGSRFADTVGIWAPAFSDAEYRRESAWLSPNHQDLYVLNIATGERKLVKKQVRASLKLSPEEGYAYWYDRAERNWFAFDLDDGRTLNLTNAIEFAMWDEDNDTPDDPYPYGSVGWVGDSLFVVQDRFDLWGIRPQNAKNPINLTRGKGRETNTVFTYQQLNPKQKNLPNKTWLLTTFNRIDKTEGVVELAIQSGELTELISPEAAHFTNFYKAEKADVLLYRKGTFEVYPDVYHSNLALAAPKKITNANPQQNKFNWGTAELVHWKGGQGTMLDGLLYKPEDFDPAKKYPMLVYFYERNADELHHYKTPGPSASTINIPYYVSNGYLVFVPDVVYEIGRPGESAYDCIVSGTKMLMKEPWVDATRIGLQGQSWGGYQVAYLITQTDKMYACAMAGAPVSNMTSAYGGIRWGSGVSREFQYERTQSRLGKTLWDDRDVYIENSPLFYADEVETPLLMMHNDEDGAVPWYQSIEYFMALRRLSKPVWLLVYNGEDHNLKERHNRKDLSIRMAQFFDYYLKDAPMPEWMRDGRPASEKEKNPATQFAK
jgi:dipeptidyl aminopeptidase/acylaminoacyl peptidase